MTRKIENPIATEPLEALLDAAVDAIVIIDASGKILRFNRAAQSMFGRSESEILGKNVSTLMPEPYRALHDGYLSQYAKGGSAGIIGIGREIVGMRENGEIFPMHLSVGEIRGSGDASFVGIIRDLSEEKETEANVRELETHLAHADRLVMLGQLTAGIAHEINQPLTAIAAFADAGARMLRTDVPEAKTELENICQRVAQQARRAGDVVNRLRLLSRRGTITKNPHEISSLIAGVLLLFDYELKNSDVSMDVDIEAGLPMVNVDETQLQQVIVNLIKNSFDALKAAKTENPQIKVRVRRAAGLLDVIVEDNGPGVAEDMVKQLFEPFFTTKLAGVGLGLSICKNIAIAHGGNLSYQHGENGGAKFKLNLPLDYIG